MFSAAFETLYAGTGSIVYRADSSMEPTDVDLISTFSFEQSYQHVSGGHEYAVR